MGPHVPRRRFSFARRECGVRFSKVPLFGGACSKVGEEALQATWKDSISFASTIKVRSPNGLKALRYERRDCRFDPCPNHYGPVGQRFKPSHFLCEDPSSNLGGTTKWDLGALSMSCTATFRDGGDWHRAKQGRLQSVPPPRLV